MLANYSLMHYIPPGPIIIYTSQYTIPIYQQEYEQPMCPVLEFNLPSEIKEFNISFENTKISPPREQKKQPETNQNQTNKIQKVKQNKYFEKTKHQPKNQYKYTTKPPILLPKGRRNF